MVPLAQALVRGGHDIAFASAAAMLPSITASGFRGFPAGLDWIAGDPEHPRPVPRAGDLPWAFWVTDLAPPMVADLAALCDAWQPDLLVRDTSEYGACIVGEQRGLPHASVGIG